MILREYGESKVTLKGCPMESKGSIRRGMGVCGNYKGRISV